MRKPDLWKDVRRFECSRGAQPHSLSLSRGGATLAMGTFYDGIMVTNIWNTQDAKRTAGIDGACIGCLSPEGKKVFVAKGKDVVAYEFQEGKPEARDTFTGHTAAISCVTCSLDGKYVAASSSSPTNVVRVWYVETGKPLDHFKRHSQGITCIRFAPDGKRLLSATGDGVLRIYDVQTGSIVHETPPQAAAILGATFTPGGGRAVFGMSDGTIKVWQLPSP